MPVTYAPVSSYITSKPAGLNLSWLFNLAHLIARYNAYHLSVIITNYPDHALANSPNEVWPELYEIPC